ncbi:hypothetical protein HN588_01690 [Candidatus Bathyarchaeota archaeon]|nr:hypothetical protein [Candidatus Bathyarchaeota archaeon]
MVKRPASTDPIVIGVDAASKRVAFVAIWGHKFHTMAVTKLGKTGAEACAGAWTVTHDFLHGLPWTDTKQIQAYVEWPVLGRGGFRSTMVQAFTSGAVQGALHDWGCETHGANVSSWKKQVVGKGNATKDEVARSLQLRWPSLYATVEGDQDLCDAASIALYGRLVQRSDMG